MEFSEQLLNQLIVAGGCSGAIYAYFGNKGLPASILAFMFAFIFRDVALGVAGGVLVLFLVLNVFGRGRAKSKPKPTSERSEDADVIDAEFSVVREEGNQWTNPVRHSKRFGS